MTSAHNALIHSISQIAMTPVIWEPFPHYEVKNIFPKSYYQTLLARIPDLSFFSSENESVNHLNLVTDLFYDGICDKFDEMNLEDKVKDFWSDFIEYYMSEIFVSSILDKYKTFPEENVYMTGSIIIDTKGSGLGSNFKQLDKVAVVLYYIPGIASCSSVLNTMFSFKPVKNINNYCLSSWYGYQQDGNVERQIIETFIKRDIPIEEIREEKQ